MRRTRFPKETWALWRVPSSKLMGCLYWMTAALFVGKSPFHVQMYPSVVARLASAPHSGSRLSCACADPWRAGPGLGKAERPSCICASQFSQGTPVNKDQVVPGDKGKEAGPAIRTPTDLRNLNQCDNSRPAQLGLHLSTQAAQPFLWVLFKLTTMIGCLGNRLG